MALRVYRDTISQLDYLKSKAQTSALYNEKQYQSALAKGTEAATNYLGVISSNIGNMDLGDFSYNQFQTYRDGEDAALYLYTKTMLDKDKTDIDEETGEEYNVYERNMAYLDDIYKRNAAQDIYDGLSAFEKTFHSSVGFVGKIFSDIYSIGENLLDAVTFIAEGATRIVDDNAADVIRDFGSKDITGARALENAILDYHNKYTFWDKNVLAKITMDVASGIAKMAPMLFAGPIGYASKIGSSLYYAAAAGATYNETIQANPDINYGNLFAYVAGTTAVEWGTEKISSLFGDTAIDAIFKGAGSVAGTTGLNVFAKMGLDSLTEGIEEGVSEFFGGLLNHWLVDPAAPAVSLEDILYASLIGGITGGVMTSVNVAGTPRLAVSKDGELDYASTLRREGRDIEKTLGGFKSYKIMSLLERIDSIQATNVADLKNKYNIDEDTLRKNHAEEFDRAESKDIEIRNKKYDAAAKLSVLMDKIGATKFESAVNVLEQAEQAANEKINNYKKAKAYIASRTGLSTVNRQYEQEFSEVNKGASITIDDSPSDEFRRVARVIADKYGVALVSGTIGEKDGKPVKPITVTNNAILVDSNLVEKLSYQQLMDTVIKQKLTDLLLSDQTMNDENALKTILQDAMPYDIDVSKPLPKDVKKTLAQQLLFDDIAIENAFYTKKSIFKKAVNWIQKRIERNRMLKRNEGTKVEFRLLLEARERYIKAVANNIGNDSDAQDAKKLFVMNDEEYISKIKGAYQTDAINKHVALMKLDMTTGTKTKIQAYKELLRARRSTNLEEKLDWKLAARDERYFQPDFVRYVMERYPSLTWENALWSYLSDKGLAVNTENGDVFEPMPLLNNTKKNFIRELEYVINDNGNTFVLRNFERADDIFMDKLNSRVDMSNVNVFFTRNLQTKGATQTDIKTGKINCYVRIQDSVDATLHTLYHEINHACCLLNGLGVGSSKAQIRTALSKLPEKLLKNYASRMLTEDSVKKLSDEDLLEETAFAIYQNVKGELLAESRVKDVFLSGDYFEIDLRDDIVVISGKGKFFGIKLMGANLNLSEQDNPSKARIAVDALMDKYPTSEDMEKAGFSPEAARTIFNTKPTEEELISIILTDKKTSRSARNTIIKALYPKNKNMKSFEDVAEAIKSSGEGHYRPMTAAIGLHLLNASVTNGDFEWLRNSFTQRSLVDDTKKIDKLLNETAKNLKERFKTIKSELDSYKNNPIPVEKIRDMFESLPADSQAIIKAAVDVYVNKVFLNDHFYEKINTNEDIAKRLFKIDYGYSKIKSFELYDALMRGLGEEKTTDSSTATDKSFVDIVGDASQAEASEDGYDDSNTEEEGSDFSDPLSILIKKDTSTKDRESLESTMERKKTRALEDMSNAYKEWLILPAGEQADEIKSRVLKEHRNIAAYRRALSNPNVKLTDDVRQALTDIVSGKVLMDAVDYAVNEIRKLPTETPEQDGIALDKLATLSKRIYDSKEELNAKYRQEGEEIKTDEQGKLLDTQVVAELMLHVPALRNILKKRGLTAKEEIAYIDQQIKTGEKVIRRSTGKQSNIISEYTTKKAEASVKKEASEKAAEATTTKLRGMDAIKQWIKWRAEAIDASKTLAQDERALKLEKAKHEDEQSGSLINMLENRIASAKDAEKLIQTYTKKINEEAERRISELEAELKEIKSSDYQKETVYNAVKDLSEKERAQAGKSVLDNIQNRKREIREELQQLREVLVKEGKSDTTPKELPVTKTEIEKKTSEVKEKPVEKTAPISKKTIEKKTKEVKEKITDVNKLYDKLETVEKKIKKTLDEYSKRISLLEDKVHELGESFEMDYSYEIADLEEQINDLMRERDEIINPLMDESTKLRNEITKINNSLRQEEIKKAVKKPTVEPVVEETVKKAPETKAKPSTKQITTSEKELNKLKADKLAIEKTIKKLESEQEIIKTNDYFKQQLRKDRKKALDEMKSNYPGLDSYKLNKLKSDSIESDTKKRVEKERKDIENRIVEQKQRLKDINDKIKNIVTAEETTETVVDNNADLLTAKNELTRKENLLKTINSKEYGEKLFSDIQKEKKTAKAQDVAAETLKEITKQKQETQKNIEKLKEKIKKLETPDTSKPFETKQPTPKKNSDYVVKKPKDNKISSIIEVINDKTYRTYENSPYTEIKVSTAKLKSDVETDREYFAASQAAFEEAKIDVLSQLKTDEDYVAVLEAIETGELTGPEAEMFMNFMYDHGFGLSKETYEKFNTVDKLITEKAQTVGLRRNRTERGSLSSTVSSVNDEATKKFELSDSFVKKYLPEMLNKEETIAELLEEISSLEKELANTKDALDKERLQQTRLEKAHKLRMLEQENKAALLDIKIKELETRETEQGKAIEEKSKIIEKFNEELIEFSEKYIPPKPPKNGTLLSPAGSVRVANFLENLESWRYLALLSNPATWGKNAISNTLVFTTELITDYFGKTFTKWDRNKVPEYIKQGNYYGDYDERFITFTDKLFGNIVKRDTQSSKYDTQQIKTRQKEWKEAQRKQKQNAVIQKGQALVSWALNDQPWTDPRTRKNLRGMLAGCRDLLLEEVLITLQGKYKIKATTAGELADRIAETNTKVAEQLRAAEKGDLIALTQLSYDLNKSKDENGRIVLKGLLGDIYNTALYRGNELFFKVDTALSNLVSNISKSNKYVGMAIRALVPFVRTTINTTRYMLSHSPIGLAQGFFRLLKNTRSNNNDMRNELRDMFTNPTGKYFKAYEDAMIVAEKSWVDSGKLKKDFSKPSIEEWLRDKQLITRTEYDAVWGGVDKNISNIYKKYYNEGAVRGNSIGLSDVFGRAAAMEKFAQGTMGTGMLLLGVIMGLLLDIEIDEEDIYGPILKFGDFKISLEDLSPFSTIATLGSILTSPNIEDKWDNLVQILIDQSIFGVLDSTIKYNSGAAQFFETATINYLQQYIPSVSKNITKWFDRSKKDKSGNFFWKTLKTAGSNLPLLSLLVPDKINPYTGEAETYYDTTLGVIFGGFSPITIRSNKMSDLEKAAKAYGAESAGLSGRFSYNGEEFTVTGKSKENLAKYRADYIQSEYNKITSGQKLVTVETSDGKRLTTNWSKLNASQRERVLKNLYSDASNKAKIKYWTVDLGNTYKTNNKIEYQQYKQLFGKNIAYDANWSKSKFVER